MPREIRAVDLYEMSANFGRLRPYKKTFGDKKTLQWSEITGRLFNFFFFCPMQRRVVAVSVVFYVIHRTFFFQHRVYMYKRPKFPLYGK